MKYCGIKKRISIDAENNVLTPSSVRLALALILTHLHSNNLPNPLEIECSFGVLASLENTALVVIGHASHVIGFGSYERKIWGVPLVPRLSAPRGTLSFYDERRERYAEIVNIAEPSGYDAVGVLETEN